MLVKKKENAKNQLFLKRFLAALVCYVLLCAFPFSVFGQVKLRSENREAYNTTDRLQSKITDKFKTKPLSLGKIPEQVKRKTSSDEIKGETFQGERGITETISQIMERERNTPKGLFDPNFLEQRKREIAFKPQKKKLPGAPEVARFPFNSEDDKLFESSLLPQTIGTSIAGPGRNADALSVTPPDSTGDVGPTQVLLHSNGRIKVYDKLTGAVGGLDVADTVFWNSVSNGFSISDPRVEYDRLSGRWFLCMINGESTLNRVMIAVSSGSTITDTSSFTFFQITTASEFLDNPTLGVDANALYIGGNIFISSSGSFSSTRAYVINKANLLSGTLTATVFDNLATGATDGPWTPQGVSNDDASFAEGYFIGVDTQAFGLLQIRRVSNPGGTPTLSANLSVTVPTTNFPANQEHQGRDTTTFARLLDALDDRLFQAQIVRNNVTGTSTLWTAHNIRVDTGGVASTGAGSRNGSRWYEIENLTGTPSLRQSGTLFDNAAADPNGFWIPSIAMSGQGHAAIGANSAGVNRFAELWAAGRLRTDTLGLTQAPTQAQASSNAYNLESASVQRWGEYSKTTVDPCDNQSMWHIGEYTDAVNSWRMRAFKMVAPGPPAGVSPSPASIGNGQSSVNVVVTGTSVGGTEFYDNPAGFVCNASCNSTGTGNCRMAATVTSSPLASPLTINSVTFNSPTQVTVNVTTAGASNGTHTIQIKNPDGQATSFDLQVLPPTAATAPLGGNIRTGEGTPLGNARVTILDSETGESSTLTTNEQGQYLQPSALVGRNYVVTPSHDGFSFTPPSRLVSFFEENLGVDFIAASSAPSQSVFNDFDGDGKTDPAVYRPADQNWYIWQSQTQAMRVANWGLPTDLLTPADYDGDGKTDPAVYRPSTGMWYVRRSGDGGITTRQFGQEGDIPAAGNYDGDNRADFAVFRPGEGVWYILQSTDDAARSVRWGMQGDRPAPGDYDGDGKIDPTVYRPADGRWYSLHSASGRQNSIPFGLSADQIAPADYDGDGKTDIAVYRPSSGAWFVLQSSDSSASIQLFGIENDRVVSGDYNGDGRADISLYRPDDSTWYVRRSDGGFTAQKWGTTDDAPAIPSYLR